MKGKKMKKETRAIERFDQISFKDFGQLILTQGDHESLTVEADEELLPELITEVRDGKLVLGIEDNWFRRIGNIFSSVFSSKEHKVIYTLTFVDLNSVSISGQCHLECDQLETDNLKLNVAGLGNLEFGHLDVNILKVIISGRGEFSAKGRADQVELRISGSGEYEASDLASQSMRVVISGQGNANVRVAESLDITISGLGQVNYYGQPKIRQVISGLGKSKRLNEA
jgi:hypothetical protein